MCYFTLITPKGSELIVFRSHFVVISCILDTVRRTSLNCCDYKFSLILNLALGIFYDFMVLFGALHLASALGLEGQVKTKIEALIIFKLELFLNLCKACQVIVMASIPPSAFSAGRIRETQYMEISKISQGKNSPKFFNDGSTELSPLKYNSKLMNSIWGFYNRYSPHNVKKINDARAFNGELQQSVANSPNKSEPIINLPSKLDNMWASINVSQSH